VHPASPTSKRRKVGASQWRAPLDTPDSRQQQDQQHQRQQAQRDQQHQRQLLGDRVAALVQSRDGLQALARALSPARFIAVVREHEALDAARRGAAAADAAVHAVEGVLAAKQRELAAARAAVAAAAAQLSEALSRPSLAGGTVGQKQPQE
jgi:hypothetical protein